MQMVTQRYEQYVLILESLVIDQLDFLGVKRIYMFRRLSEVNFNPGLYLLSSRTEMIITKPLVGTSFP